MSSITDYTGWTRPLKVRLTGTTNEFLRDHLPLVGLLTVHETSTDNTAAVNRVTFRALDRDGNPGPAVIVPEPQFTYPA